MKIIVSTGDPNRFCSEDSGGAGIQEPAESPARFRNQSAGGEQGENDDVPQTADTASRQVEGRKSVTEQGRS